MILKNNEKIKHYTAKGIWGERCLHDYFEQHVKDRPKATALIDGPDRARFCEGEARRFDYQELDRAIDRLAHFFASLGLGREDVLVSQLPNPHQGRDNHGAY